MRSAGLFLLSLAWFPFISGADLARTLPVLERHLRPGDQGAPTAVSINAYIIDILDIDDVEGTITVDYFLIQTWNDPRLADANFADAARKRDLTIEDIWNPSLSRVNLKSSIPGEVLLNIDTSGNVFSRQRQIDTFTTPLDLRRFPFDRQLFRLNFLSSIYGSDQVDLIANMERSGFMERFSIHGWSFEEFEIVKTGQTLSSIKSLDRSFIGIDLNLTLERIPAFYVWKVIFPLAFIVFMAWTVFWIDPAEFGGQVTISTASVITLIAFQFSLTELLPQIPYLTKIDYYASGTAFLVFLAHGESILTARLAKIQRHKTALRIDRYMRWTYPLAYVVLLLIVTL